MSILKHTPEFPDKQIIAIASSEFGLRVRSQHRLPGERDQNVLLETETGRWILKVANAAELPAVLEAQAGLMRHLEGAGFEVPTVLPTGSGRNLAEIFGVDASSYLVRVVSYIDGFPLSSCSYRSPSLLNSVGSMIGRLVRELESFTSKELDRQFLWDCRNADEIIRSRLHLITDTELLGRVHRCLSDYEKFVRSAAPELPLGVIHNDANDGNIIVRMDPSGDAEQTLAAGLIDFGDAIRSWQICELAIAIAYAIFDTMDPISAMCEIVRGYSRERKISEPEAQALFGLLKIRLCMSAVIAAEQQQLMPENEYLSVSQAPLQELLPKLCSIPYVVATDLLRDAAGMNVRREVAVAGQWLHEHVEDAAFPVDLPKGNSGLIPVDLSASSLWLAGDPQSWTTTSVQEAVNLATGDLRSIAVGRYMEPRLLYASEQYSGTATGSDPYSRERRTIHLGLDLFAPAGTTVRAVYDGVVERVDRCDAPLDYGTLVILRHEPENGVLFYSLYGHLSSACRRLEVGRRVKAGTAIAELGDSDDNGGWPPHLHFQYATELLGFASNFPGVCRASQQRIWRLLCPDPSPTLRIVNSSCPDCSQTLHECQDRRDGNWAPSVSLSYRKPIKIVRGWRHELFDESGRRYLDAYNNVPHVGHAHPVVAETIARHASVLNTNTRYLHDLQNEYAETLSDTLPEPLSVCMFVNSATEANELALRLARAATGQKDVVVLEGAYHGHSTSLIDISPYKHNGPGGSGAPNWVHTAPVADTYRGEYKDPETAGAQYAFCVDRLIRSMDESGRSLAAFIAESCPSVGGQIIFPQGYLSRVYEAVRNAGGVCIADEVQTAYGRTGKFFYGFEQQDVVPDIVVLGKPIGNGFPLAAVVTTVEIARAFDTGMEFFSTFGGSTLSCAVGLAVLNVTLQERLQENAETVGLRLREQLMALKAEHAVIGDVRGSGLFLGLELVLDQESMVPADLEARFVVDRMRDLGILLGTDGPLHNVVKIRPPMCFDVPAADFLVHGLRKAFASLSMRRSS